METRLQTFKLLKMAAPSYPQFAFTVYQRQNFIDFHDFRHVMPDY